jgi:REP element-mobilizing transposase RayT
MSELPQRKRLPHDVPLWVDPSREVYFITVNCQPKARNQLAHPAVAQAIFETVAFRNAQHLWFVHLFLIMPDHVHALMSFPPSGKPMRMVISQWKEWTAKQLGIEWQQDFFEHRLRREESRREKADYILENPVRAKLVERPEQWPWVWFPDGQRPRFED